MKHHFTNYVQVQSKFDSEIIHSWICSIDILYITIYTIYGGKIYYSIANTLLVQF